MQKPSWDDAPEWARYLAQDDDGWWYWFDEKPVFDDDIGCFWVGSQNGLCMSCNFVSSPEFYMDSLEEKAPE